MNGRQLAERLSRERAVWSDEFLTRLAAHERSWGDEAYPPYEAVLDRPTLDDILAAKIVAFWLPHAGRGRYGRRWVITTHDNPLAVEIYFRQLLNRATLRWMPTVFVAAYTGKGKLTQGTVSVDFQETPLPLGADNLTAKQGVRDALAVHKERWSAEFLAQVAHHERVWGKQAYPDRPTLEAMLAAKTVIFWSPIIGRGRIDERRMATVHDSAADVQQYFQALMKRAILRWAERVFIVAYADGRRLTHLSITVQLDEVEIP